MNRFVLVLPLLATAAMSTHAQTFVDSARVRNVQPQYETVAIPRQECSSQWINETHRVEGQRSYGGAVIGGVAGAVLGNQLGKGHGREAATALGAVVGAFTGDRVGSHGNDRYEQVPRQVQTCQTVSDLQQRLTGYQVTYDYRGQQFVALLPQDPGPQLQVRVSVDPVMR
ncbi:MAG TPA: glycine zipper 2TM domain-containing protein [Burkholderiaceae bacterium]|nr:glycine zipper 2TM domain-containing protein [Rhodoferax sp.]HQX60144.1 glycine zipper 2TM domain-containing protein [Burkholderiaceae bacterium]HQZ07173.1 glycine zipper 2TM domain-containing protein [Burkholderiaceae bacterium]